MTTLDVIAEEHTVPAFFHLLGVNGVKCAFRVTKPVAGLSVNKHKQATTLGAKSSTKPSTKLCAYFFGEIGNRSLRTESGGGMRGTTNILGMTQR